MADGLRVALYTRVSTSGQTVENQLRALLEVAERRGWRVVEIYQDNGVSGGRGRDQRPGFARLCRDAARRRFDLVAAWSVDRLGRSLQHLVGFLGDLEAAGVGLYLHQEALDTTTPSGRAMFQLAGVFGEYERAMLRERVNAGLARARAQGKRLGRPRIPAATEALIRHALHRREKGIQAIAREHGVGVSAVQRIQRELAVAR